LQKADVQQAEMQRAGAQRPEAQRAEAPRAPAVFVSHGAPTFALEPGVLGPALTNLGARLDLAAALVVSAHWQTAGVTVMRTVAPETLHDFRGFPPELYRLQYPSPGAPGFAHDAAQLLEAAGIKVSFDDMRGIDHGVWVPLRYLLPRAQTPVFQVSLPFALDAAGAMRLGQVLAPLRRQGVMIMGSGSLTHNLSEVRAGSGAATYALEFTAWVREAVQRRDVGALEDYRHLAPHAQRAHPTDEHFLPLLVAVGAADASDSVTVIEGGMTYDVLSMESYAFAHRAN
jgi:4,5-DOPA dioxygenase extradiol